MPIATSPAPDAVPVPARRRAVDRLAAAPVATLLTATLVGGLVAAVTIEPDRTARPAPMAVARPLPTPTAARPLPTPTAARRTALPPEDLEGRLADPGPGFDRISDARAKTGDLTAAELISRSASSPQDVTDGVAGFRALGLEKIRGHAWTGESEVDLLVYRFRTAAGAAQLIATANEDTTGRFRSRLVPAALTTLDRSPVGTVQSGLFARGRFVYEVDVVDSLGAPNRTLFEQVLRSVRDKALRSDPKV